MLAQDLEGLRLYIHKAQLADFTQRTCESSLQGFAGFDRRTFNLALVLHQHFVTVLFVYCDVIATRQVAIRRLQIVQRSCPNVMQCCQCKHPACLDLAGDPYCAQCERVGRHFEQVLASRSERRQLQTDTTGEMMEDDTHAAGGSNASSMGLTQEVTNVLNRYRTGIRHRQHDAEQLHQAAQQQLQQATSDAAAAQAQLVSA